MGEYYLEFEKPIQEIDQSINDLKETNVKDENMSFANEINQLQKQKTYVMKTIYQNLTPWQTAQVARHAERPLLQDYIKRMFDEFLEFHGDRLFRDDPAIITGFGKINGEKFMIIGEEKGRTTKERIFRNFGMPYPEGYRKALRAMRLAEKYHVPILTFVDTNGAYCGLASEERGQGEAIARNMFEMSALKTPIVTTIIGEGGSGGALAIAVGDRVLMLENSIYSVISPEGCASILWNDANKKDEAAQALKFTAKDLLGLEVIEEIIPEPMGGAHRSHEETIANVKEAILRHMNELKKMPLSKLVQKRYERFRKLGKFTGEVQG